MGIVFQACKHACIIVFHEATDTRWKLDVEETRDMVQGALMFKEKEERRRPTRSVLWEPYSLCVEECGNRL